MKNYIKSVISSFIIAFIGLVFIIFVLANEIEHLKERLTKIEKQYGKSNKIIK